MQLDTGLHRAVKPSSSEYSQHRKKPSGEAEKAQFREAWASVNEAAKHVSATQQRLAEEWPDDMTPVHDIPLLAAAIDWERQPPVPAEKIDWSRQGEPLRVRPTLGTMITAIAMIVSILGGGAYFYWGVRTHHDNLQVHVPQSGIPWGVQAQFETRKEAKRSRTELVSEIRKVMKSDHDQLREDIVKALRRRRR